MGRENWDRARCEAFRTAAYEVAREGMARERVIDAACARFGVTRHQAQKGIHRGLGAALGDLADEAWAAARSGASAPVVASGTLNRAQELNRAQDSGAPAWQGYSPRQSWRPPEPARPVRALAAEVRRIVHLTDLHSPFHDRRAVACARGVIADYKPHRVVLGGDVADLESLSRHPKSRPDLVRLSEEYYETNVLLDDLQDAAPDATWDFLEGNHEGRASRYCAELGNLDGMLSVPQALYVEPRGEYRRDTSQLRGMNWIPLRSQPMTLDGVAFLHGLYESKHHAAAHAENLGPRCGAKVICYGHMHGFQSATSAAGYSAYACGYLGEEGAPVFAYTKGRPRPWGHGILLIEVAGDAVSVTPVHIAGGRALVAGHLVAAA